MPSSPSPTKKSPRSTIPNTKRRFCAKMAKSPNAICRIFRRRFCITKKPAKRRKPIGRRCLPSNRSTRIKKPGKNSSISTKAPYRSRPMSWSKARICARWPILSKSNSIAKKKPSPSTKRACNSIAATTSRDRIYCATIGDSIIGKNSSAFSTSNTKPVARWACLGSRYIGNRASNSIASIEKKTPSKR